MGSKRIKHFRHQTKSDHGTERESQAHLAMKKLIAKECQTESRNFELEVEITHDKKTHIVDGIIYFSNDEKNKFQSKGLAVECQCSPISIQEYTERNLTYSKNELIPWWLLGGDYFNHTQKTSDHFDFQRIRNIEKEILSDQGFLVYVFQDVFFRGSFEYKIISTFAGIEKKSKSSGIYNIEKADYKNIFSRQMNRFLNIWEEKLLEHEEEEHSIRAREELPKTFCDMIRRNIEVGDLRAIDWLMRNGLSLPQADDFIKKLLEEKKLTKTKYGLKPSSKAFSK